MNPRSKALVCCLAIVPLLLSACASNPTLTADQAASANAPPAIDTSNLPRLVLSGATLAEVKSLAMGAARSRGWMIRYADSTPDRLVVGRPAEASVLALAAPNLTTASGAMLEVTTLLKDVGGGVEVATLAEVVTPTQQGAAAGRIDYTEQFREPLTQSLHSLRERWMRDRERLARAAPPPEGWKSAWELPLAAAAAAPSPPPAPPVAVAPTPPAPTSAPVPVAAPPKPPAAPLKVAAPVPVATAAKPAPVAKPAAPAKVATPPAKPTAAKAAVAAKVAPPAKPVTPTKPATPAQTAAAAPPKPAAAKPAAPKAQWSAKAEQYARQRGCKVGNSGAQLIESRKDGEVYKVPCQGSDSSLIRCKGGTCQGLL